MKTGSVSIVIPALNDSDALARLVPTLPDDPDVELIVVNGGVVDASLKGLAAAHPNLRWLASPPGRGRQMNVGAREARGEWLVFLHADTRLPEQWLQELRGIGSDRSIVGGSFRFELDSDTLWARAIEAGVAARVRLLGLPYGDQALFTRRTAFEAIGGYREWPLMEDVDLVGRLKRTGRLHHSRLPVVTSARRWQADGWWWRSAANVGLVLLFAAGVSPQRLARAYHKHSGSAPGDRAAVGVMARAPSDATGKTRLMRSVGVEGEGLRRALLLDTLDAVRRIQTADVFVLFTPDQASAEFHSLTDAAALLMPQRGDGLGQRLHNAFADLLALGYSRVVIVGSDLPTLPVSYVEQGLGHLAGGGERIVLGPATDGGYYLIGLQAGWPPLFEGMKWSTPDVFQATVALAEARGLRVMLTPPWHDVDEADDLRRAVQSATAPDSPGQRTRTWVESHAAVLCSPDRYSSDRYSSEPASSDRS
jgi:rSAM/selenodomain-associated transferase 2/rSAM/selenodomain-associated transferase 1